MSALYVFLRHLTALLYPVRCPICSKVIGAMDSFCNECEDGLVRYNGILKMPKAEKFIAAYEYNEKISPAVFIMKDGISGNAPYALGTALAERIKSAQISVDFIVPVPMYRENLYKRGFNQAELIAREIGRILDIEVRADIVLKNRKTLPQKELTKAQRKINLKGAFSVVNKKEVQNKRILIVDDVCTTGSTLSEITNLLAEYDAKSIFCACACKTPELKRGVKK